jgi:DNA-binding LytR/AlgR family response regulator
MFGAFAVGALPGLFGAVLLISAAMTAIMIVVNQPGRVTHAATADATPSPVRFLERLPPKLRGAAIYAVSAEDHYLRLHTSKGSDLILMRLADAISELEGLEGAQTHRSWWVAKDAVESTRRDGDRVTLTLKGGVEAPVSRPNIKPLREAGWF